MMVLAVFCVFALAVPSARAASLSATQVEAVTTLLKAFDVDSSTIADVEAVLGGSKLSDDDSEDEDEDEDGDDSRSLNSGKGSFNSGKYGGASVCGMLERSLRRGSSGEDVSRLQEYLKEKGFFTASTTGFFGLVTERALQEWQAREGVVKEGDAESTGFGVLGPQTRQRIMAHCKESLQGSASGALKESSNKAPICTLKATDKHIELGESVTLVWESKNAEWASSVGGEQGPTSGSVTVTPEETTTYVKRVYSASGEGMCTATVKVGDDTTAADEPEVVVVPLSANVANALSAMGVGLGVVWEGYLNFFR